MASWRDIEQEAPELVERARTYLDARKHKTIATLRKDGSPRISGTEANVVDGELEWGSMLDAWKARDLQRDPRFALHGGSDDPPDWTGDVKVSGLAIEVVDDDARKALVAAQGHEESGGPSEFHLFRADIKELVVTRLNDERTRLEIVRWREGDGVKTVER